MTGEHLFVLVIVVIFIAIMVIAMNLSRIKSMILERLRNSLEAERRTPHEPGQPVTASEPGLLAAEEESMAEWKRLQNFIRDRKQFAGNTDISYHLWGFYNSHFRDPGPQSPGGFMQDGEWYDVKTLKVGTQNGVNTFEFELKGARYKFADDEESQGWCENIKFFSLFLYDDSDRCLIEIPMKMRVDKLGRNYSILSDGPNAFLPGGWINDFISVTLKHQHIRNQEIRAQKHQERLSEIEDLKGRFGVSD